MNDSVQKKLTAFVFFTALRLFICKHKFSYSLSLGFFLLSMRKKNWDKFMQMKQTMKNDADEMSGKEFLRNFKKEFLGRAFERGVLLKDL